MAKINRSRQASDIHRKHWSQEYDKDSEQYNIYNTLGECVAAVVEERDAKIIVNAINEYIDRLRTYGTPNVALPRATTLLRAIMDAVRRSRQRFDDRALEGVSSYGEYGACVVHHTGSCPPFNPYDIGLEKMVCQYELESFVIALPDSTRYRVTINRME